MTGDIVLCFLQHLEYPSKCIANRLEHHTSGESKIPRRASRGEQGELFEVSNNFVLE